MSFKGKKPNTIPEGYYYNASEMDEYLAIVEPLAEKLEAVRTWWLLFNQCIDSEAVKEKLEELLKEAS